MPLSLAQQQASHVVEAGGARRGRNCTSRLGAGRRHGKLSVGRCLRASGRPGRALTLVAATAPFSHPTRVAHVLTPPRAQVKAIADIIMAVYLENQMYQEQLEFMQVAACTANPDAEICSGFFAADFSTGVSGLTLPIVAEYLPTLASMGALDDCWVTPIEMSRDAQTAEFISTFIQSTAAAQGVDPNTIVVSGLSTDGDSQPGCNGNQLVVPPLPLISSDNYVVHVDPAVSSNFGTASAWADCYLDEAEIAANAAAQAWVAAFRVHRAEQLGVNPLDVPVIGMSLDSDNNPGCAPGFSGRRMLTESMKEGLLKGHTFSGNLVTVASHRMLSVDVSPVVVGKIAERIPAFEDGRLTESEMAADDAASALSKDIRRRLCETLQTDDCSFVIKDINGVTPDLNARLELLVPLTHAASDSRISAVTKSVLNSLA